ncbi:MAG: IclR family transcriptional regulator [Rhodospirillales bacterium]
MSEETRYIVPALERGLRVLRAFSRERPAIGLADLARELALPKTTVFRIMHTLESMGFVRRLDDGRTFRLGPAVLTLGFEYLAALELPEVARPALEALRDATGASSHLAIRDGAEIVYVSRYASRSALASNINVGSRLAAHASSMGRVLLADLDPAALDALYGDAPLDRYTDQTPTTLAALKEMLTADRRRGFVISRAFYEKGVVSIAAPVRDATGRAVAAINLTGAAHLVEPGALETTMKDAVLQAAEKISGWLGHRAAAPARIAAAS